MSSFVALPTRHEDGPAIWFAIGDGSSPTQWACIRSWLQGENVTAGIVDPELTPLSRVVSPVLTRAQVLAEPAIKARSFAVHDELLARHPDLRQALAPGEGRNFSFQMPDCVFAQPAALRSRRNQQNFAECGDRLFIRALLPIRVSDGGEIRVGVWVEVPAEAFFQLMKVWDEPEQYLATKLAGTVENALTLPGGNLKGTQVTVAPRTADECLFVSGTSATWLSQLIDKGVSASDLPMMVGELATNGKRMASA